MNTPAVAQQSYINFWTAPKQAGWVGLGIRVTKAAAFMLTVAVATKGMGIASSFLAEKIAVTAFPSTLKVAHVFQEFGIACNIIAEKAFLTVAVPVYAVTYALPKWILTTAIPKTATAINAYIVQPLIQLGQRTLKLVQSVIEKIANQFYQWVILPVSKGIESVFLSIRDYIILPIVRGVESVVNGVISLIDGIYTHVIKRFLSLVQGIYKGIYHYMIKPIGNLILSTASRVYGVVKWIWSNVTYPVLNAYFKLLSKVGHLVVDVLKGIGNLFLYPFKLTANAANFVWTHLIKPLASFIIFDVLKPIFGNLIKLAKFGYKTFVAPIVSGVLAIGSAVKSAVGATAHAVYAVVEKVLSTLLSPIFRVISAAAQGVSNLIGRTVQTITDAGSSLIQSIQNTCKWIAAQ